MYVYCIKNTVNDKCYIGQTTNRLFSDRKYNHKYLLDNNKHYNDYLQNSWNKYDEENFKWVILEQDFDSIDELNKAEIFWIEYLRTTNSKSGYNIMRGGKNCKHSPETKRKISRNHYESKKVLKYDLDGNFVTKYNSLKEGAKSVGFDYGHNIGLCCRREKKSAGGYQWRYWEKGFPIKIEPYKKEHSRHNTRKVKQLTKEGEHIKTFDSLEEARKVVNLKTSVPIGEVCRGNYNTSKGYKWEYSNK